jgi:hypothetical protein
METLALAHTPARLPLTPDTIAGVSVAALSQHWRMGHALVVRFTSHLSGHFCEC